MGGVYVLTSHCNFKTCVNVPHVNKTVTDFLGGIYRYTPPVATPLDDASTTVVPRFILSSTTADITNLTSLQ